MSTLVINRPDDVTVCEGTTTTLTCALNSNTRYNDLQWYRLINDTGTTVVIDLDDDPLTVSTHTGNTINNSLTITNIITSYAGYYWVGTPYFNVCNASLTVVISTYVKQFIAYKLHVYT